MKTDVDALHRVPVFSLKLLIPVEKRAKGRKR